jgi:hypothetical protein
MILIENLQLTPWKAYMLEFVHNFYLTKNYMHTFYKYFKEKK